MKNILRINFFFYVVFLLSILTGNFKIFITITLITIFHELGHIITGLIFNFNIEKITIVPFGLVTTFNKKINEKIYIDLIVTFAGPIFQLLLLLIIKDPQIIYINKLLLIFNLLPIIPLDGSKIVSSLLELVFSYKTAYNITFYISISTLILLIDANLTIILICFLYLISNLLYIRNKDFCHNKFLLERYLYKFKFKKSNHIYGSNVKNMKKFKKNVFITQKNIENEEEILKVMFDNRHHLW